MQREKVIYFSLPRGSPCIWILVLSVKSRDKDQTVSLGYIGSDIYVNRLICYNFKFLLVLQNTHSLLIYFPSFLLRRRVVQVYERGARILDGSFMTHNLNLGPTISEPGSEGCVVASVSIADPYVVLRMTDGSIRLLVGGTVFKA